MSDDIVIYEAGARSHSGKYGKFIESRVEREVDDYIDIMRGVVPGNYEIVKLKKTFRCICTIPTICKSSRS